MGIRIFDRPTKKSKLSDPLVDGEFSNIYKHLKKVALGPFSLFFSDANEALYLQETNRNGEVKTILKVVSTDCATNPGKLVINSNYGILSDSMEDSYDIDTDNAGLL
jgi:hypothetical protein